MTGDHENRQLGLIVWITGLSGAGKSSVARELAGQLRDLGRPVVVLDGDEVRAAIADPNVNHDRISRIANAMRLCRLAKLLADQGVYVVTATMSLFKEIHDWNRSNFDRYFEAYLKVDLEILKRRDARQLYSQAQAGKVKNVVGVDLEFDEPQNPDLVLDNTAELHTLSALAAQILEQLKAKGYC